MTTQHSAILLFAMHRQILLSVISIPPLSQADSSGCILQSFFRGLLATFPLLMIYFSPIKVHLQFENAAIHNTTFLTVVLCICQDKAAWYCIDLYFVQKDSGNIRSCVCSSSLKEWWDKHWHFQAKQSQPFTCPLGASCIGVRVWFCVHRRWNQS